MTAARHPFRALWAMMVGFFLIVADSTVVAVANPVIKRAFDVNYDAVMWVTSVYLLTFAVCLLVGGRLGDRFGPKNVYLLGLAVFTASSLWCGLSGSIGMLIAARAVQGVGAALLTPQTFATITRTFPLDRRGIAMSLWGATAGVGMFAGPLAGGVLVDRLGWQWIFLINVPIGIAGFVLGVLLIPNLPGRRHPLDLFGVLLSGAGIGLVVFGLQEGQNHEWAWWIWGAIVTGLGLLVGFVGWQAAQRREPLIPLMLFRHRDFGLSNAGIALVSFAFVAFAVPLMFYLQEVCGLSATRSAMLMAPLAIATAVLAPVVGWLVDRAQPRPIVGFGFAMLTVGLIWLSLEMTPTTPIWRLVLPLTVMGVAGAFTWEPLAVIASRTLPNDLAGAGSAVYNAVRQLGAVLSSASVAALMTWLLGAKPSDRAASLPDALKDPFADAMSHSMLLPAFAAALGATTALFLAGRPQPAARTTASRYRSARDMRVAL
jgi:EmrB/QacA subfamily drug resistance transporter